MDREERKIEYPEVSGFRRLCQNHFSRMDPYEGDYIPECENFNQLYRKNESWNWYPDKCASP